MKKVKVSREVYDGLMEARDTGLVNMLSFDEVLEMLDLLARDEARDWVLNNRSQYTAGILFGFAVEDEDERQS